MAANDYRGYLRNHMTMENGEARLHAAHGSHRPLLVGTLAVMGLLQVASSVTILLHLTGYLHEVKPPVHAGSAATACRAPRCRNTHQKLNVHFLISALGFVIAWFKLERKEKENCSVFRT